MIDSSPVKRDSLARRRSPWQRFVPLLQKELRETLRDRRTIATLFVMPLLVYPILSLLLQNFLPRQLDNGDSVRFRFVIQSSEAVPPFMQRLGLADRSLLSESQLPELQRRPPKLDQLMSGQVQAPGETPDKIQPAGGVANALTGSLVPPEEIAVADHVWTPVEESFDINAVVADGNVDLGIRFIDLGNANIQRRRQDGLRGKAVELVYNPASEFSRRAAQYLSMRIERANLLESQLTLSQLKVPRHLALARVEIPVQSNTVSTMSGFATFIPLILIMMTITGAVYPAIDLTAGERERGTLESLVAAPISRMGVLFAKYLSVFVVAMLTATLNIVSMLVTMWVFQLDRILLSDGITLALVVQVFLLLALYALFFSAVLLVLTSVARSFKEAQAYLVPLMVFSLAPGILAMMPEVGQALWLAVVPMVNLVLLARDVMQGEAGIIFTLLAVISTLLYSVAALAMAANLFGSDAVLYGSEGGWRELLGSRGRQRIPSPAFAFLVLALLFSSQFLLLGVMGRYREFWNPQQTVIAIAAGTIALFLLLPVTLVVLRGYAFRETFALRWPGLGHLTGGALLGAGVWPFVGLALYGLGQLYQRWMGAGQEEWSQRVIQIAATQVEGWQSIPIPWLLLALAIVPAVCEEFFFRGLLLQSLTRKVSSGKAILISGLAFGVFHFIVESSVAPLRFVVTSTMGFVLAWVCLKSRSLLPGILLHSINNALLTSLALLREQLATRVDLQSPSSLKIVGVLAVALFLVVAGYLLLTRTTRQSRVKPVAVVGIWLLVFCGFPVWDVGSKIWAANPVQLTTVADEQRPTVSQDDLPGVAAGWSIQRYADDALAHDIHCLAVGPEDEVFVAGPGFIMELIDEDGDGIADRRRSFAFQPRQGPQGLLVEREAVWAVTDGAIWRIDRSTGTGRRFVELPKTGGEHDFHALRRGDDGFLYFVAGNHAAIDRSFVTGKSPILSPQHGVVGRISPDGSLRQVLVDGMRNAYDFDFDLDGALLVYDSDDERDSGLPWYRPTTLFRAIEGQNIGWISRCYKQPKGAVGNATVRAETGRGSPTGVATLHQTQWGWSWLGATVFADWTFGRIYLQRHPALDPDQAVLQLVYSRNGAAFAPTDLAFDSQGQLYISVGGRDTAGAVYRVRCEEVRHPQDAARQQETLDFLQQVLDTDDWRLADEHRERLRQLAAEPDDSWVQEIASLLVRRSIRAMTLNPKVREDEVAHLRSWFLEPTAGMAPDWSADLAIWLAMNPQAPKVPLSMADAASKHRRTEMMASMAHRQLQSIVAQNEMGREYRVLALAALALQRSIPEELMNPALELLVEDVTLGPVLSIDDWLIVMQAVLAMPLPNDGNTSPWDFMKHARRISAEQRQALSLDESLATIWRKEFGDADASSERLLNYLKLELLLEIDADQLLQHWQMWQKRFEPMAGPLDRLEAFVLLAAIRAPYPEPIQQVACDFLLNVDQQLRVAGVSIDNNWSQRFDAIGRLLLADAETARRFVQSQDWKRPTQIHSLKLLNAIQQVKPLQQMANVWQEWDANQVSQEFRGNLTSVVAQWRLVLKQMPAERRRQMQELSGEIATFQARVTRERAAYLESLTRELQGNASNTESVSVDVLVENVDWSQGNGRRGEQLYAALNCLRCHAKAGRLGPSLAGVTRRFSRRDLLEAIVNPSSNVNDRYRALLVETTAGRVLSGIPVYKSTDGMILEDAEGKTWQLSRDDIEQAQTSQRSLMPDGLMGKASDQDWADLLRYLESLQ